MPSKTAALRSPIAQNLAAAVVAGGATFLRPQRLPKWARRGLNAGRAAGTAGSLFLDRNSSNGNDLVGAGRAGGRANTAANASSAFATATGGLGLVTSVVGLKADAKVENYLLKRGVRRPRIWMGLGMIAVVFAIKQAQDAAAKHGDKLAQQAIAKNNSSTDQGISSTAPSP